MPIYEYQCAACGHSMEILQKIGAPAPDECPECHKDAMKKQVTAAAFKLKGTGWYETDFKNKKSNDAKAQDKAPSSTANNATDKKTSASTTDKN